MTDGSAHVHTVDDLRSYVHDTLCRHENLVAEQFVLQVIPLTQVGKNCGLQFILRGPRSVRLGAVWASRQNQLYFYDARGERFQKERLAQSIQAAEEAA